MPRCNLIALILFLLPYACSAQTAAKASSPDAYANEALVFEQSDTTYRMRADGTGERDVHVVVRVQSQGAAQQLGVLAFAYASANETPVIKYIHVHKADGSTVDTPPDSAIDMPADVTREAPLYSDLKEKHVPVRSLSAGDTLEYEVDTRIDKAEAAGEFWGAMHFSPPGSVVVLAETLTLEFPAAKYVQVWSPNHKPTITETDGEKSYHWSVPQLVTAPRSDEDNQKKVPLPKDPDEDGDGRKLPSVAWTTFHNWAEVGDWYRSLARAQAQPDDAVRARAEELTKNAATPEDQVRALYNFVSTQNRYVGIDFGIGRYRPHAAAEVLANQYGDCKDKDTLLEALLQAKGFSTAPALIGAGIAPVADVPSPAVFNHVITTVNLPTGRIWLDSTPAGAPYRYLSAMIRDQKALVVAPQGPAALEATPADAPYPFVEAFDAAGTLDAEGKLTAKMTATYHDDNEVGVRIAARAAAPAERDKVSQFFSTYLGFGGTTSDTQFGNADDSSKPITVTYDYTRHPFGDWDNLRIIPLFPALEFTPLASDTTAPEEDIQLGAPRTLTVTSRIRLAEGFRPDLPDPVHVKTEFATFDKTYRFEGNEIVAERKVVVLKRKIAAADWKNYKQFTTDISLNSEAWIQLIRASKPLVVEEKNAPDGKSKILSSDGKTTVVAVPSQTPAAGNPAAAPAPGATVTELMSQVMGKMKAKDWDGAKQLLNQVKDKDPKAKGLWGEYGVLAEFVDRNFDQAKEDFRKELAIQPDNESVVGALAALDVRTGNSMDARQTLESFFALHPGDARIANYLASLQTAASDNDGALKTLQKAAEANPADRNLAIQVGETLVRLHRNQEAAAAAESAMDGSDDADVLNNGAYVLSEAGVDLSAAEAASRKCIAKLEEESAEITTEEANSRAFARATLLVASWDTLGWILHSEGKDDEAEPFISAGWRAALSAETGDHLAQIYEAAGNKDRAYSTYILAMAATDGNTPLDVKGHISESIARLRPAGEKPAQGRNVDALQALRTYKIVKPADASGWGTFRLEITTAGVVESQQMTGGPKLALLKPALTAMKFPELFPSGSKAHLLRSAVVSCSMGNSCQVVLVPGGGLQTEQD